jgi:hypothetical protein
MNGNIPFNSGAISASQCISDGWELIKDNYWLFFGMAALGVVLLGCIPCVNIFLMGPFLVGIYTALLIKMRGGPVTFDMLFKGFEKFVPAMVLGLIENIPTIISYIFRFTVDLASIGLDMNKRGKPDFDFYAPSDMAPAIAGGVALIALVVIVVFILFAWAWRITFMFALPILSEHNLPVMDCLKLGARAGWSNVGGIIVLMILQGLMILLGVLALCIGWIFVIPVMVASNMIAYRMVFPEINVQTTQFNEPPRPDFYGSSFGNG